MSWSVPCMAPYNTLCASFTQECSRVVLDGAFSERDITDLRDIAAKGMSARESMGGPTILDINTGFLRDTNGVQNLFTESNEVFSSSDFEKYGNIIRHLKNLVSSTFGAEVYFTAPTFITRLDGRSSWNPQEIHDEYWHIHADMNNTAHYHFSGLLYLSNYEEDFTGGRLLFYPPATPLSLSPGVEPEQIIEPVAGRTVIFSSGPENPHRVERLLAGQRLVLAFWFTCDQSREFQIFLDGKAHTVFSKKIKQQLERQNRKQQSAEL
eukprot:CAMPEP_0185026834 /NCGR_PEP_ID=MMETSP1103-20130426/11351_1 /TAXON_ID=36769 /ORGANISM="Paraphysomonas bandaiensis, Strain Caron Lab Isolate" /LENGTH=265 /DNA_ID=CAMNT_0027560553 /DNA_START=73 /DNA_END=870 /DNA_ORIENTATION=+